MLLRIFTGILLCALPCRADVNTSIAHFSAESKVLQQSWDAHAVKVREAPIQYPVAHLWLTGDSQTIQHALLNAQNTCLSTTLLAPLLLSTWFYYTNDHDTLRLVMTTTIPRLFETCAQWEDESGLLSPGDIELRKALLRWTESETLSYPVNDDTALNQIYAKALTETARLCRVLGQDDSLYMKKAARVQDALQAAGVLDTLCHPQDQQILTMIEDTLGLRYTWPGATTLAIQSGMVKEQGAFRLQLPNPKGHITVNYIPGAGYRYTVPKGVAVQITEKEGVPVVLQHESNDTAHALPEEVTARLTALGWQERVGDKRGVWIDVDHQRFYILDGLSLLWSRQCATASAGVGTITNSLKTPPGWHQISDKFGEGSPWGQVFRSRQPTSEIWKPGQDTKEDLVLTRVLWLDGLEDGINRGNNADGVLVDSKQRCIYIHGTNGEARIGTPSSHGCVRLLNDDVIQAFEQLPVGTPVLITATQQGDK